MSLKPRVLVVEPMSANIRIIKQTFAESMFDVIGLSSPALGRKQIAASPPALAFVSTEYLGNEAYLLCKEAARRGVAVILLEKAPTRDNVLRGIRHGALDVLLSPPAPELLAVRAQKALVKLGKALPRPDETHKIEFPEDAKTPRSRVEYALKKAQSLLALPHAVSAVLRLCSQPQTSAADLVGPIETDSAITVAVFRAANSAAYAAAQPVTDLRNAVARLGMKTTANLAMTQSVFEMFERHGDTFGFDRTEYWVHSLGAACCARRLTTLWKGIDSEDAFLAGLLHDLGKLLLDEYLPAEYQQAVTAANVEGLPIRFGERRTIGLDHAHVGGQVAKHWELPERLCATIADHHSYDALLAPEKLETWEKEATLQLVRCAALADQLSKAFGFGHAGDFLIEPEALDLWGKVDWTRLSIRQLYSQVREDLVEALDLLRISRKELRSVPTDTDLGSVALDLPQEQQHYRPVLEAFFTRLGFSINGRPAGGAEHLAPSPCAMGLVSLSGTLEELKQAARQLRTQSRAGLILTDCSEVNREGCDLAEGIVAARRPLDFYVLGELIKRIQPGQKSATPSA